MMSDEMLSQDEIDALLRGTDDDSLNQIDLEEENYLSPIEKDALGEIGNISFGSASTALSTLLNQKVEITTPTVTVIKKANISDEFPIPYIGIQVNYTQGFTGGNILIIKQSDAAIIVDLMLGGDGSNPPEVLDEIQLSAVQEAMNQMMGSAATSMSTVFNKRVDISPPSIDLIDIPHGQGTEKIPDDELLVKVSFRLKVGSLIDSSLMQLLPLDFSIKLVEELMNPGKSNQNDSLSKVPDQPLTIPSYYENGLGTSSGQLPNQAVTGYQQQAATAQSSYPGQAQAATLEKPATEKQQQGYQHMGTSFPGGEQPNIQPAVFSNFEPQSQQGTEPKNLAMLMDIPLQVTVELGSTKRSVKEILELSSGSIIELDKLAGEPVDILVNNRLVAQGEVVVIDENFGVRVTDIISQSDRLKKLR
ncbi:flagellar motor switch phosphatase FliY [Bacillus sp. EB600]|uniref:flagellar motor switch phosphatase FliY n=1 Tax=Bacillus sp. EB600 TaxID=2806345 RepID=UPI00210DB6D6|nr:flagellar motor switch phosphatase FliY [Bacillus sp. EB600]MCQ6280190.1 flagellar motor switch phosphatase FliY [Bacillus sp. EB600]